MIKQFPESFQADSMDCGPTCLHMIAKHYGKNIPISFLRECCGISREGVPYLIYVSVLKK